MRRNSLLKFLAFTVIGVTFISAFLLVYIEIFKTSIVPLAGYSCYAPLYLVRGGSYTYAFLNTNLCQIHPIVAGIAGGFLILGFIAAAYISGPELDRQKNLRIGAKVFLASVAISMVAIVLIEVFVVR